MALFASALGIGHAKLRRVVLVEGDQYYREVLTGELLRQGFVVHAFADGAALLGSLATAVDADVAVLDWDLPRMSGIELMAELRQQSVNLPVVFLTGKVIAGDENDRCLLAPREALDADECMAFDHGAVDFIAKSRDRQVLARRLRRIVELVKPKADVAVEERLACGKLRAEAGNRPRLLEPGRCRPHARGIQTSSVCWLRTSARFVTSRAVYDCLHYKGFIAGTGEDGYRANVRSAIKRIRNKFRACDPAFDEIENYNGFGYCWRKPLGKAVVIQLASDGG